jgi:hypothetical protein
MSIRCRLSRVSYCVIYVVRIMSQVLSYSMSKRHVDWVFPPDFVYKDKENVVRQQEKLSVFLSC